MKIHPYAILAVCAALFAVTPCSSQVSFTFNYLDRGTGFNDPTRGAIRRAALESAAAEFARYFTGYSPRTVVLDAYFYANTYYTGPSLSSSFFVDDAPGPFQPTLAADVVQRGDNHNWTPYGALLFNSSYSWDYDDAVASNSYDFKAAATHGLVHLMGFISAFNADGTSHVGTNLYAKFDQYLTDANGNPLVDSNGNFVGGSILSDGIGNDIYFSGPNAMAAYGGRVPVYSPAASADFIGLSHLNQNIFTDYPYLMELDGYPGPATRTLSAIELGILADLGYNVTAIPEPATVALLGGLAALALVVWRRRA